MDSVAQVNSMNEKIGNYTEEKMINILSQKGYWCHRFAHNKNGQPCDIIALKNDTSVLIDVKHCDSQKFEFRNIRENQETCFELAKQMNNKNTGFAIYFEFKASFRRLSYEKYVFFKKQKKNKIEYDECERMFYDL